MSVTPTAYATLGRLKDAIHEVAAFDSEIVAHTKDVMIGTRGIDPRLQSFHTDAAMACWIPSILAGTHEPARQGRFCKAVQAIQAEIDATLWPPENWIGNDMVKPQRSWPSNTILA